MTPSRPAEIEALEEHLRRTRFWTASVEEVCKIARTALADLAEANEAIEGLRESEVQLKMVNARLERELAEARDAFNDLDGTEIKCRCRGCKTDTCGTCDEEGCDACVERRIQVATARREKLKKARAAARAERDNAVARAAESGEEYCKARAEADALKVANTSLPPNPVVSYPAEPAERLNGEAFVKIPLGNWNAYKLRLENIQKFAALSRPSPPEPSRSKRGCPDYCDEMLPDEYHDEEEPDELRTDILDYVKRGAALARDGRGER